MTPVQARQAATEGLPVRIAVATNRGAMYVPGTVERIRPQPDGAIRVDVQTAATTHYNCSLDSVRVEQ